MRKLTLIAILCCLITSTLSAQEKWDVRRCVEYAITNAITVKQADINRQTAEVTYKQSQLSRIPNANVTADAGYQFGRSIDPTTNLYTNQKLAFQDLNLNANVVIFNWNRIRNNILANKYESEAALADVASAKNDIALTVASNYLSSLLAKVQVDIATVQLEQTKSQLNDTRKRVDAGALPELNALDLEAQAARDSSNLLSAQASYDLSLLTLKGSMNLDFAAPFDIVTPDVSTIPIDNIADLQPATVYQIALSNQPAQRANQLRMQSLDYFARATRSTLYPTFSAFGGVGSNFSNSNLLITDPQIVGYSSKPGGSKVNVSGTDYPLLTPDFSYVTSNRSFTEMWNGWGTQISDHFRQNVGIAMNVPIFNGWSARANYERAKINYKGAQVTKERIDQALKQNIYMAYSSAVAALQKFNASKSSLNTAERAFDISSKRYAVGLLSTLELITSQANLNRAKIDVANAQFDYVFKMKILEYYKGEGIKL